MSTGHSRARKSRAKRDYRWEEAIKTQDGRFVKFVDAVTSKFPSLTRTERQVAALVRCGLKSFEIANLLKVTEKSVENYRNRIRRKLRLSTLQSLLAYFTKRLK